MYMSKTDGQIKQLLEKLVIKMLEEDLDEKEPANSLSSGTTIINVKENNNIYMLLYLLLRDHQEKLPATKDEDEILDMIQRIESLQEQNNRLYKDISNYLDSSTT